WNHRPAVRSRRCRRGTDRRGRLGFRHDCRVGSRSDWRRYRILPGMAHGRPGEWSRCAQCGAAMTEERDRAASGIAKDDPLGRATVEAIQRGDLRTLKCLLDDHAGLATMRIGGRSNTCQSATNTRTLLHIATDWPGHFPNAAATVAMLVDAGADVRARFDGRPTETPLHWPPAVTTSKSWMRCSIAVRTSKRLEQSSAAALHSLTRGGSANGRPLAGLSNAARDRTCGRPRRSV